MLPPFDRVVNLIQRSNQLINLNSSTCTVASMNFTILWQLFTLVCQIVFFLFVISSVSKIFRIIRFARKFKHLPQGRSGLILGDINRFVFKSSSVLISPSSPSSSSSSPTFDKASSTNTWTNSIRTPLRDATEYYNSRRTKSKKGIGVIWLGWFPIVFCLNYKSAEVILSSRKHLSKGRFYKFIAPFMKDGLITSSGDKWRLRRKLIGPAFNTMILSDFIPIMTSNAEILVEKFGKMANSTANLVEHIHLTSLDIICRTAMGISPEAQERPSSSIVRAVTWMTQEFSNRIFNPLLWYDWIFYKSPMGKNFLKHLQNFDGFSNSIIESRINANFKHQDEMKTFANHYDSNGNRIDRNGRKESPLNRRSGDGMGRKAFLDLLLEKYFQSFNSNRVPIINLEGIKEEINTFLFAGYETTGTATMWILYLLGLHQDIQERVHEEVCSVFGSDLSNVTLERIRKLTYLEQCIKEGLRLFPPVPMVARELEEEVILDGYKVPKGTSIAIMIYTIHRDPDVFPNPNCFDPERFSPESMHSIPPNGFIPFSAGPRVCLGQRFAYVEMKIIITFIIKKFIMVSQEPLEKIPYEFEVTIRPKVPLNVKFTPRSCETKAG